MTSETPQKGDCSRRSDENESDEIRLHARPARVTASRDHRGVLGGPICNRKHADLGPLEHLGLTLAAYAASGTARALARAKLRRAGIVRARSGTPNALESAAGYYARGRGSGGRSAHPLSTKAPVAGADVAEQPKARGSHRFQFVSSPDPNRCVRQLATARRLAGHERPATRYGTKPRRRYGSATALLPLGCRDFSGGNKCTKSRGTGAVSGLESLALARRRVFTGSVSGHGGRFFQSPGLPNLDARAGDVLEAARAVRAVIELAG
jgi:hypothetical protein